MSNKNTLFGVLSKIVHRNIYKDTNMTTRTYNGYDTVRKAIKDNTICNDVDPYDLFSTVRPTQWPNTTNPSEQELLEWVTSDMATFMFEIIGFVICQEGQDVEVGLNPIKISKLTEDWVIDTTGTHEITIQSYSNVVTCKPRDSSITHVVNIPIILESILHEVKSLFDSNYRDILNAYRVDESDVKSTTETKLLEYSLRIKELLDGPTDLTTFVKEIKDIREDMIQHLNDRDKPTNTTRLYERN